MSLIGARTARLSPRRSGAAGPDNDAAIAALPGLLAWWKADSWCFTLEADGRLRWNDVIGGAILRTASTSLPARSQATGQLPILTFTGAEEFDAPDFVIPTNEWSIAVVHRLDSVASGVRSIYGPKTTATQTPDCAALAFNAGIGRMINTSSSSEIIGTGSDHRGVAAYNLSTKSVALGMALCRDGTQLISNGTKTSPLDDPSFGVGNALGGSTGRYVGTLSDVLIFNLDLSAAANAATRAALDSFMNARRLLI